MDYKTLYESVLKLPEYRKKHTYYPMGKERFKILTLQKALNFYA